jgi:hypothetical protein
MARLTIIISVLLILLGLVAYFCFAEGDARSVTALIPAFFGIPILACGLIGNKVAMHAAMVFALLGVIAPLGRLIPVSIKDGFTFDSKSGTMLGMAILCLILLIFGIRSFIAARKAVKEA